MDETELAATAKADASDTELLPPRTVQRPELAYSAEDETDDFGDLWSEDDDHAYAWGTVKMFAALMAITMAASGVVGYVWWSHHRGAAPLPPVTSSAPSALPSGPDDRIVPSTAPPVQPPTTHPPRPLQFDSRGVPMMPDNPTAPELQQILIADLDNAGIPYADPRGAVIDADSVCQYLKSGHHRGSQMFAWIQQTHPALTSDQVGKFAGASVGVYCRQFGYLFNQSVGSDDATS